MKDCVQLKSVFFFFGSKEAVLVAKKHNAELQICFSSASLLLKTKNAVWFLRISMDKSFNSLFAEINIFAVPLTRGTCCETGNYSARTMLCYHQILKIISIFLLACMWPLPSSECYAGKQHCSWRLGGDPVPPHKVSWVGEEKEAGNKASSLNSLKKNKIKKKK